MPANLNAKPRDLATADDASPTYTPGTVFTDPDNGDVFRYVQVKNSGSVTPAVGKCVYWQDRTFGTAICETKNSVTSNSKVVAGMLQVACTATHYTWIKSRGLGTSTATLTTGGPTKTDGSGVCADASAATDDHVGIAGLQATSATPVHLDCP